jgi:HD-like signal output (HDOD) protein
MSLAWILLAAAAVAIVATTLLVARSRSHTAAAPPSREGRAPAAFAGADKVAADASPRPVRSHVSSVSPIAPAATEPLAARPSALLQWDFVDADSLAPARRDAIVSVFKNVPRPPRLLARLVSSDLVHEASAAELADLIGSEPVIAARVLAAVNAPVYALSRSVTGITQAVTVLGVQAVRSIGLRYVLQETFRSDSAERTRLLQTTWQSSALASELCQRPLQRLALADGGGLDAAVVLSFLGRLAIAAAVPSGLLDRIPPRDFARRIVAEQTTLGLTAVQIGRLLMRQWQLPGDVADAPVAIDGTVLRPWSPNLSPSHVRGAFGYVCARLGEQIAHGEHAALDPFDLAQAEGDEWACARGYLVDAQFASLMAQLQDVAVRERVDALQRTMHP